MNFKRHREKGKRQKSHRIWLDEAKRYRISWSSEYQGIRIRPCFYALVRTVASPQDLFEMWDFVGVRRGYKTLSKATEACELHERIWNAVLALGKQKNFIERLKAIKARSIAGRGPLRRSMLSGLPKWVLPLCNRRILDSLFPPAH